MSRSTNTLLEKLEIWWLNSVGRTSMIRTEEMAVFQAKSLLSSARSWTRSSDNERKKRKRLQGSRVGKLEPSLLSDCLFLLTMLIIFKLYEPLTANFQSQISHHICKAQHPASIGHLKRGGTRRLCWVCEWSSQDASRIKNKEDAEIIECGQGSNGKWGERLLHWSRSLKSKKAASF